MDNKVEKIKGVEIISLPTFSDKRGFFREVVRINEIEEIIGKSFVVKQVNHSRSSRNTLRGIHAAPWDKLIYVTKGKVQSVIVDFRKNSPTFGKYISIVLGEENKSCVFIPAFCGNSYLVLSEDADYVYLTSEEWSAKREIGVLWNDPNLGIDWMLEGEPVLSEKDKNNPTLEQAF